MDKKIIEKWLKNQKNIKLPIIIGLAGILLIAFSSIIFPEDKVEAQAPSSPNSYDYCQWLEEKIAATVNQITGKKGANVLVTLETGVEYVYATEQKKDNSNTGQTDGGKFSESGSLAETYITVKDQNGNEEAVVLTELTPRIRGVSIVCHGGQRAEVANAIVSTLSVALDIPSENISVAGSGIY